MGKETATPATNGWLKSFAGGYPFPMTKRHLQELYEVVRAAAHAGGALARDEVESVELADALDQFVEECDHAWEARLVEWAMDNGFPDFETVLQYGLDL